MKKTTTNILLIIGILLFVNLVSEQYYFRLDLTENNEYTLEESTKDILESLEEPITITAYFSNNLPPHIMQTRKTLEEYLVEYARLSDGNLVYQFIDPAEQKSAEQKAISEGIYPIMISVREENEMKQQKAFMGIVLASENGKGTIPLVQPSISLEYALSAAIKKITVVDKPSMGVLTAYGSAGLTDLREVQNELKDLYDLKEIGIDDDLSPYKTLAVLKPEDSIPEKLFDKLDNFLKGGGNLFLGINTVDGDLQNASGKLQTTGFADWLNTKGITLNKDFVIDANCGSVGLVQGQGFFSYTVNVEFPYLPIVEKFADHPVTQNLEAVILKFVSSINYTASEDTTQTFTPLLFSSNYSDVQTAPTYFNIQKKWSKRDFKQKNLTLAGLLEKTHENGNTSKIFLVADGDFPISSAESRSQINKDNANLMVNAVDWMTDDSGLINLRAKGIIYRPLEQLESSTQNLLKYLNFLLPILLVIGYGVVRMQRNKLKRMKRMSENY